MKGKLKKITRYIIGLALFTHGINMSAQTYYNQGTEYLQNGNYLKADSLFTLSIEGIPNKDAFYNRAITRMYMKDLKGFCLDLKSAASFEDLDAKKLHEEQCLKIDTLYYSENFELVEDNWAYKEIIEKEKYYDLTEGSFYNIKDEIISDYKIVNNYKWFDRLPKRPEFIGGERKLLKFISDHIMYPESENDAYKKYPGSFATVYVQFDINEKGVVNNVQVADFKKEQTLKYISTNFVKEALRVVKLLPNYEIPLFMGKPVVFRYIMPIKFSFPK